MILDESSINMTSSTFDDTTGSAIESYNSKIELHNVII